MKSIKEISFENLQAELDKAILFYHMNGGKAFKKFESHIHFNEDGKAERVEEITQHEVNKSICEIFTALLNYAKDLEGVEEFEIQGGLFDVFTDSKYINLTPFYFLHNFLQVYGGLELSMRKNAIGFLIFEVKSAKTSVKGLSIIVKCDLIKGTQEIMLNPEHTEVKVEDGKAVVKFL